jgi:hypothetical protein
MNKKYISYIIVTILCLNLLPQTSNAFKTNPERTDVVYDSEVEKDGWKTFYLPYAKHLGLVNKTTTILDIAKKAEEEENNDLIIEIMNRTHYERGKMLVKWERDNGYISSEKEKDLEITPLVRKKLLAEIDEEEEKTESFWWKIGKASTKVVSFGATLAISRWLAKDWGASGKNATFTMLTFTTILEAVEAVWAWRWRKSKTEEEMKLPPLRNMPPIPANHTKVDIYSL